MTSRFNSNILTAARRLQDARSDASANGDAGRRYKSIIWQDYENRAIREIIFETFKSLGVNFGGLIPEYMKTSGTLTVSGAKTVRPTDSWIVTELVDSNKKVKFVSLSDDEVLDVTIGKRTLLIPTDENPCFYQERDSIVILPSATKIESVIARYIVVHQDIVVNTSSSTNGNYLATSPAAWVGSTRRLTATMNVPFAVTDINKLIMFKNNGIVYTGRIESYILGNLVTIIGDGLPAATFANVDMVMVGDNNPDGSDLILKATWDSVIVDKMVQYASQDAARGMNA